MDIYSSQEYTPKYNHDLSSMSFRHELQFSSVKLLMFLQSVMYHIPNPMFYLYINQNWVVNIVVCLHPSKILQKPSPWGVGGDVFLDYCTIAICQAIFIVSRCKWWGLGLNIYIQVQTYLQILLLYKVCWPF